MRKILVSLFLLIFIVSISNAQCPKIPDNMIPKFGDLLNKGIRIFTKTENESQFPGGNQKWDDYFKMHFDSSMLITKKIPGGTYTVIVWTVIDTSGKRLLTAPETNYGYGLEHELIRVLNEGPDWIPAKQNNYLVTAFKCVTAIIKVD